MRDEVSIIRLSRAMPGVWVESQIGPHIALPAAKHAALMRAVDALRALRRAERDLSWDALNAARHDADRALMVIDATAPERQGEEPK